MKGTRRYTDLELIRMVQSGGKPCNKAMVYLYQTHWERIFAFIRGNGGNEAEAKDVFQDAVVQVLMGIRTGKFEGRSALGTYIYAIARNLWYRRFGRETKLEAIQVGDLDLSWLPEESYLQGDRFRFLEEVLGKLKTKCLEVLRLWSLSFSMKEIAQQLSYQNEQVVRNKKNRCLKELKELVRQNPELRKHMAELRIGS